ncbi:hypothetical protein NUW58_g5935 [Xylaria curta]|uniref:Uncharacterized protein n=1 Tax=Xylaria curta TaxID=42375 RepID=A0ACC1P0G3_9PEZI|nr:hypothetical protein NUW58_g5935 [Xylaria curta]
MSNPWNLANMVEEKKLKSTFVIATLCTTLINTFTTSVNLWDRMNERRKQKKKDAKQVSIPIFLRRVPMLITTQDDEIRKLKENVAQAEGSNQKQGTQDRRRPAGKGDDDDRGDGLSQSLERSEALIRREYNDGAGRLGKRFAVGDLITENQLQTQVITLQDALLNHRPLSHGDVQKLTAASLAARNGSLDALRQQYQRLSFEAYPRQRSLPDPKHHSSDMGAGELFCKYSLALQNTPEMPLSASFAPGGDGRCPACGIQLDPETAGTYWHVEKKVQANADEAKRGSVEAYHFDLGQRFIVKCHTWTLRSRSVSYPLYFVD